ncbi:MAG: hypothetical protein Q9198_003566 [Flavoplaca austrocitrina]
MPRKPVTKNPTSIEVGMAKVFFSRWDSFKTERLPPFAASALGSSNIGPVTFDRESISFAQRGKGNSCVVRLMKGDFTLESLEFEKTISSLSNAVTIVANISCHKKPLYELTPSKRKNGILEAQKIPLGQVASKMASIRIELTDERSHWKVRGVTKGKTLTDLKRQLDIICAGSYVSMTALLNKRDSEDEDPLEEDQIPTSEVVSTATDSQPRPASRNNQLSSPTHPIKRPFPAKISFPGNPYTPSVSLPQTPPSLTAPKKSTNLKRKLDALKAQYNKIDKEEKEFIKRSRAKKEKL